MANIKSSIKRIKIAEANTIRNRAIKTGVRTAIKKFETAIADGDFENAKAMYPEISGRIDRAANKGVFHQNAANRKKAQLALKLEITAK
ncbi:MAG TPA: 30S ribosomal protein S20 [Clostridia bacterium]|nr:30S ribosomal protein S20 [Clostridia bacterium]